MLKIYNHIGIPRICDFCGRNNHKHYNSRRSSFDGYGLCVICLMQYFSKYPKIGHVLSSCKGIRINNEQTS